MSDPYASDPFGDIDVPTYDDGPHIGQRSVSMFERRTIRERIATAADAALLSPRWDQIRGLILLGSTVFVAAIIALVAVFVVGTGAFVLVRTLWEAI